MSKMKIKNKQCVHPLWLRICHWLNALSIVVMIMSGWRIYNASPLYNFKFINDITLGGWLGGALQWHFAGMWLFLVNGCIYILLNIISCRVSKRYWPLSCRGLISDISAALKGKLDHQNPSEYNMVQKLAYLFVIFDSGILSISGLVLWKPVQFSMLHDLLGGYEIARQIHFFSMLAMVIFTVVHLLMVMLVPRTLITMLRGR